MAFYLTSLAHPVPNLHLVCYTPTPYSMSVPVTNLLLTPPFRGTTQTSREPIQPLQITNRHSPLLSALASPPAPPITLTLLAINRIEHVSTSVICAVSNPVRLLSTHLNFLAALHSWAAIQVHPVPVQTQNSPRANFDLSREACTSRYRATTIAESAFDVSLSPFKDASESSFLQQTKGAVHLAFCSLPLSS